MVVLHRNRLDPHAIQPASIRSGAVETGAAKVPSNVKDLHSVFEVKVTSVLLNQLESIRVARLSEFNHVVDHRLQGSNLKL